MPFQKHSTLPLGELLSVFPTVHPCFIHVRLDDNGNDDGNMNEMVKAFWP